MKRWICRSSVVWFTWCVQQMFSSNQILAKLTPEQRPLMAIFSQFMAISLMFWHWSSRSQPEITLVLICMMHQSFKEILMRKPEIFSILWIQSESMKWESTKPTVRFNEIEIESSQSFVSYFHIHNSCIYSISYASLCILSMFQVRTVDDQLRDGYRNNIEMTANTRRLTSWLRSSLVPPSLGVVVTQCSPSNGKWSGKNPGMNPLPARSRELWCLG